MKALSDILALGFAGGASAFAGGAGLTAGSATLDFGSTPAHGASMTVTDAGVTTASLIVPFILGSDTTGNNNANAHQCAQAALTLICTPASGSFTLEAHVLFGLAAGQFKIRYLYQ